MKAFHTPSGPRMPERIAFSGATEGRVNFADTGDAPFPTTPERLAVAVGYRNANYIADLLTPRVPAGTQSGVYDKWTKAENFRIPTTMVARDGKVRAVTRSATEGSYRCEGYGLKLFVSYEDQKNWSAGGHQADLVQTVIEFLTDLILLDRENRSAGLYFAAGTYGSSNKRTLTSTAQWSDFTNSTPLDDILGAYDAIVGGKVNGCAMGQQVWTKIRQHPDIVRAVMGGNNQRGIITRQQFKDLFELDEFLVGDAFSNSAAEGAADSYGRIWAKYALFYVKNANASMLTPQPTLAMSPQWGSRIVYERRVEPGQGGLMGGTEVIVGEYVDEITPAADAGYLFSTAVA